MSDKPLNKTAIAEAVEKAPAVAGVLKKLAGKVARGVALPGSFTAKGLDYDAQRELERLFGTLGRRQPNGESETWKGQHMTTCNTTGTCSS